MTGKEKKFWNFTAGEGEKKEATLTLYGEISGTSWFGDEVTPREFEKDLAAIGDVDEIIVRINSGGGDVFAANAIYTRLKEHKAFITVKIDGWAASAATIIAMAGDKIQIPANGVFMIHNPKMGVSGYFGASDFVDMSKELAVIKQSIINGYKLRTKKSEAELSELMDREAWFDGNGAVENGFCDEIMFSSVNTQVENERLVIVNSVLFDISEYVNIPKSLFNCRLYEGGDFTNIKQIENFQEGGRKTMETKETGQIKTVKELHAAYPDLVAAIREEAEARERKRIFDIESVALKGYEDIVNKAKFETPTDAGTAAAQIIALQKAQGEKHLSAVIEDIQNSGMEKVKTIMNTGGTESAPNPYETAINKLYPAVKQK